MNKEFRSIAFKLFTIFFIAVFLCLSKSDIALAGETVQKKKSAKLYVLVIGVSKFADAFWPELKWAESDAKNITQNVGTEAAFETVRYVLLNEKATIAEFRKNLAEVEKKATTDDLILVYISSHGTLKMGKDNVLEPVIVLHDTLNGNLARTSFSHTEIRRWLSGVKASRRAVILATCHSGVGKSRYTTEVSEFRRGEKGNSLRPLERVSEGSIILAASSRNETAIESDELKSDVYTHFFIESLSVGDRNGDGTVSLLEAHDYAKTRTYNFTKGRQRPTLEIEMIGDSDIPLKGQRKRDGKPVLEAYSEKYEGYSIGLSKGSPIELPRAILLDEGINEIVVYPPDDGRTRRFVLSAQLGEKVSIDKLFEPPPYYAAISPEFIQMDNSRFKKLTGFGLLVEPKFSLGVLFSGLDAHVSFVPKRRLIHEFRPNLTAILTSLKWGAGVAKIWHVSDWSALRFGLLGNRVNNTLTIQETVSSEGQTSRSNVWSWGWSVDSTFKFFHEVPFRFLLGFGEFFEENSFDPFGDLSMKSRFFRTGLLWEFGGSAREL